MGYFSGVDYRVIKKHYILLFLHFIKFFFFLIIGFLIGYIGIKYKNVIGEDVTKFVFFPLVFVLVNYSFFKLVLGIIEYFNYLFIVYKDQIFIIKTSLIMRNDVEVIDSFKIIKLDAYSRGFFSNLLSYGNIIIETQTKEERVYHFMPKPYQLLEILKKQRLNVLEERKRKYIIDDVEAKIQK